jgi:protein-L-isoaspartate(D-aspartate) O-methyltransferase
MRWHPGVALMLMMGGLDMLPAPPPDPAEEAALAAARARMVREQIVARGVTDARVLGAMGQVPRHEFVPAAQRSLAYEDGPLPIGHGQTISQPYVVAFMTAALAPQPRDRVLEIGTGSGYQAAVLSGLVAEVFTIEVVAPLAQRARADLQRLGFANVQIRTGDGHLGWPEAAPFDAIIVTCAPEEVPMALVEQLKAGGRMIIPVGPEHGVQELVLLRKTPGGLKQQDVLPVRFVPMVRGATER